jgi:hypothetical protein
VRSRDAQCRQGRARNEASRRLTPPLLSVECGSRMAPAELDGVLIPRYAVLIFIPLIALTVWALSFPIHPVLGGDRIAHAATGLLVSYVILGAYEWCHFLIHTPYRPHGWYYRTIWRGHRLHRYKNEHYWFGVTSTIGDHGRSGGFLAAALARADIGEATLVARESTAAVINASGRLDAERVPRRLPRPTPRGVVAERAGLTC